MRQIYYSIRTLLRERGTNIIRIISLSLGLTIGILLFSQIAFELSYEHCYPEPERLAIARCLTTNLSTGETMGDDGNNYDYTLFDVVASINGKTNCSTFTKHFVPNLILLTQNKMCILLRWFHLFSSFVYLCISLA